MGSEKELAPDHTWDSNPSPLDPAVPLNNYTELFVGKNLETVQQWGVKG